MRYLAILFLMFNNFSATASEKKTLKIYLDADFSVNKESAISIKRGILTTLEANKATLNNYDIELIILDHRGNVLRSKRNFMIASKDPNTIAIFTGMHSPPLIKNRSFINELNIPVFVPWAAGAPITRHSDSKNWIYRLSIDDSQAGPKIADYAIKQQSCKKPGLFLESTPWGDFNYITINGALKKKNINNVPAYRFGFNLTDDGAQILIARAIKDQIDCAILVSNTTEGSTLVKAIAKQSNTQIKVISHWGITGGRFENLVSYEERQKVDLNFIQTCYSFNSKVQSDFAKTVFETAQKLFPTEIKSSADIKAPVGFIHAHDLTKILLHTLKDADKNTPITALRDTISASLENDQFSLQGLIKTYTNPFDPFDPITSPNGHEALKPSDYCMGYYAKNGDIVLLE